MEATPQAIIDFVAQRAGEIWADKQEPYLLALLSPELKAKGLDYKDVVGGLRLKEFIQSEGAGRVKVILHPSQRSKVGIIPHDQDFEFSEIHTQDAASETERQPITSPRVPNSRFIVMNFLQLLATLPPEELAKVKIPTGVLAMLVKAK